MARAAFRLGALDERRPLNQALIDEPNQGERPSPIQKRRRRVPRRVMMVFLSNHSLGPPTRCQMMADEFLASSCDRLVEHGPLARGRVLRGGDFFVAEVARLRMKHGKVRSLATSATSFAEKRVSRFYLKRGEGEAPAEPPSSQRLGRSLALPSRRLQLQRMRSAHLDPSPRSRIAPFDAR